MSDQPLETHEIESEPVPAPVRGSAGLRRVDKYYGAIVDRGLGPYVSELDAYGYTVVPPELVAPAEFVDRIRSAVLRIAHERTGVEHAVDRNGDAGRYTGQPIAPGQFLLYYLLFADDVFEEWLENDTLMALVEYVMRGEVQLSSLSAFIKWKGGDYGESLGLHGDAPGNPENRLPMEYESTCNAALCLTDYTKEGGAIAMVPGSHRLGRQPMAGEGVDEAVAVEAPTGSLIVWRGGTWHGAFPRTIDGLRMNVTSYCCHPAFKTQERYGREVPDEMLARHSNRFARLVGANEFNGWKAEGPDYERPTAYLKKTREAEGSE